MLFVIGIILLVLLLMQNHIGQIEILMFCDFVFIYYLPQVFEKRREVLFWGPPPSTVSAVSVDVLPYISADIKASFFKFAMCNICKNNIAKMFLDFLKM